MAYNEELQQYVTQQLSEFKEFTTKKMFGSLSYMRDKKAFGCIVDEAFYLKADASNVEDFTSRDMKQFNPRNTKKGMPYWTCLLYTSPSPRDATLSRMPSSA